MAATSIQTTPAGIVSGSSKLPALPWRDPHSVPPEKLAEVILSLEDACAQNPSNAGLRTLLGMAHAMNYDVHGSMDALEEACRIEPDNFFARLKYSELFFRLRLMERAEEETTRALELANTAWELSLARRQLSEIRQLKRKGVTRPRWSKSLKLPVVGFALILLGLSAIYMIWR